MTAPSPTPGASAPAPESYTSSDGGFNPGGAAAVSTTASSTTTDIYGLYPYEQQWTFYTAVKNAPGTESPISPNGQDLVPGKLSGTPATEKVQTATAEQLMKEYSLLAMGNQQSRQVWANVQQQLLVSGFYGQSANTDLVKLGTWTNNDANAMLQAMRSYQQVAGEDGSGAPITFAEYLDQTASQAAANGQNASGGYGYEGSGYNISQTDPNAIKDAAQSAAQVALGHGLSDEQLSKFVSTFQQSQIDATKQLNAKGISASPDLGPDAFQYVKSINPDEYKNHQAQGYMNAFLDMFLPSQSQRPNLQPGTVAG